MTSFFLFFNIPLNFYIHTPAAFIPVQMMQLRWMAEALGERWTETMEACVYVKSSP